MAEKYFMMALARFIRVRASSLRGGGFMMDADLKFISRFFLLLLTVAVLLVSAPCSAQGKDKASPPIYVGSDACQKCHAEEYSSFVTYAKKSRSFESIERLQTRLTEEEIKKCYSCHTTGFGKPGGFVSPEQTPHLKNAGCEVCHGPGSSHVITESPEEIQLHLTTEDCEVCHISARVKAFRYKPMIHGGAH